MVNAAARATTASGTPPSTTWRWRAGWAPSTSWNASTSSATPGRSSSASWPSPTDFLLLAEALGDEDDPDIWSQVTAALSLLDRAVDDDARTLVASYARALLAPVLARLGWEARSRRGAPHPDAAGPGRGHAGHHRTGPRGPSRGPATPRRRPAGRGGARPRSRLGHHRRGGRLGRARGLRGVPGALPAPGHAPRGDPLPLRPGRVRRPGARRPDLRVRRAPRCDRRTPPSSSSCCWRTATTVRRLGTRRGALGRARGPHPGQHPAPHARRGDVAVPRHGARRPRSRRSSVPIPCPSASAPWTRPWSVWRSTCRSPAPCATRPSPVLQRWAPTPGDALSPQPAPDPAPQRWAVAGTAGPRSIHR